MRLASRFGRTQSIRQERPLTNNELIQVVPSVFSEEKHSSRSERYTCIPTITLLDKLRDEGFQPFFACQSRVRNEDKRGHTKHMVRLRREGVNKGKEVPEIILLNSHDGSSSYQMIPGMFRFVCTNGGLAPIFPYTFYHLTHYWFAAADIPVANDTPVHYADAIRCNVRRPPQGSLPLLTRRVSA